MSSPLSYWFLSIQITSVQTYFWLGTKNSKCQEDPPYSGASFEKHLVSKTASNQVIEGRQAKDCESLSNWWGRWAEACSVTGLTDRSPSIAGCSKGSMKSLHKVHNHRFFFHLDCAVEETSTTAKVWSSGLFFSCRSCAHGILSFFGTTGITFYLVISVFAYLQAFIGMSHHYCVCAWTHHFLLQQHSILQPTRLISLTIALNGQKLLLSHCTNAVTL